MSNSKKQSGGSALSICFYVVAAIVLVIAIYTIYVSVKYVSDYAAQYGTTVSAMKGQAVSYIIGQVLPYLVYALIAFGFGKVFEVLKPR